MKQNVETKIKIAVVEDQEDLQNLIESVLGLNDNFQLVGAFFDGKSALRNIPLLRPDVVLMDIGLPDISGVTCINTLKPQCPETEFMVWSTFGDEAHVFNALASGASSYLLKVAKADFIISSIEELHQGGSPMSPEIARILINGVFHRPSSKNNLPSNLTPREFEILELLSRGHLYKEIADILKIKVNTLKAHCYNIYQKLHVTNKVEAINKIFGGTDRNISL